MVKLGKQYSSVLFYKKTKTDAPLYHVFSKLRGLHQILNVSLYNLRESLSAECRHFSLHLVGF